MKTFHILSLAAIAFLVASCSGNNKEKEKILDGLKDKKEFTILSDLLYF